MPLHATSPSCPLTKCQLIPVQNEAETLLSRTWHCRRSDMSTAGETNIVQCQCHAQLAAMLGRSPTQSCQNTPSRHTCHKQPARVLVCDCKSYTQEPPLPLPAAHTPAPPCQSVPTSPSCRTSATLCLADPLPPATLGSTHSHAPWSTLSLGHLQVQGPPPQPHPRCCCRCPSWCPSWSGT